MSVSQAYWRCVCVCCFQWSLETWSRSRGTSQEQFFQISVSVSKVSGLDSVSSS